MPSSVLSVVLMLVLALMGGGNAGQSWEEQVEMQIAAIHDEIAPEYEYVSDLLIGELEPGATDGFGLELDGNADYVIVGVCDAECGDLDLAIYDPAEDQAAADIEPDDYPVLRVQGEGEFYVEVLMTDCSGETCLYAVQVFARQE